MVHIKAVSGVEKSKGGIFEEPEGMMTIDLNEGRGVVEGTKNIDDKCPGNIEKYKNNCFLCTLLGFLFVLLAFACTVALLSIHSEFQVFGPKATIKVTQSQSRIAPSPIKEKLVPIVKDIYNSGEQDKLLLCKVTKSIEDCCHIFAGVLNLRQLCTANDILEILLDLELNNKFRRKRQLIDGEPQLQQGVLPFINDMPDRLESEIPDIYKTVQTLFGPIKSHMHDNYNNEYFADYPNNDKENVNYEYGNNELNHDYSFMPNDFLPPNDFNTLPIAPPADHAVMNNDRKVDPKLPIFVQDDPRIQENMRQFSPVTENFKTIPKNIPQFNRIEETSRKPLKVLPQKTTTEIINKETESNIRINSKIEKISKLQEVNKTMELDLDNTSVHIEDGKDISSSPTMLNDQDQSTTEEFRTSTQTEATREFTSEEFKVNLTTTQINMESIRSTSSVVTSTTESIIVKTDKTTTERDTIGPTNNSTEENLKKVVTISTIIETGENKSSTSSPTETQEEITPATTIKINTESNESSSSSSTKIHEKVTPELPSLEDTKKLLRANQENEFQSKPKSFVAVTENFQSNQQTMHNPCVAQYPAPFGSPYKTGTYFDGSQLLKVVPMNSQKVQPMVIMNPPLYSYIPPHSPFIQSYAPALQQSYSAPVHASGPGGQYYMCSPIPVPSTNLEAMPGVEIRSSNLQDIVNAARDETVGAPRNNKTRATLLECPLGQQSCEDASKCIKIQQICDNEVQCADGSDELFCSCRDRIIKPYHCDGFLDCPNGEDELHCGCKANEFSCDDWNKFRRPTCIPMEQRCDNIKQCEITGKDEEDCSALSDKVGNLPQFKVSNAVGFLHRNYKGKWFPVCFGSEWWADEVCKVEAGPSNTIPRLHMMLSTSPYDGDFVNVLPNQKYSLTSSCVQDRTAFVECPPLYCGLRMTMKNAYRDEEVLTSAEDMLNNLERSSISDLLLKQIGRNTSETVGESRIVGGKSSQPAAWPWIVSIYKNGRFFCGGVIINELWILTAAHCTDRYWQNYYEIQAGILRRFSFSPMEQRHFAVEVIPHQNYDASNLKNDIALMRLNSPVRYNKYVRPICLPSETTAGRDFLQGPPPNTICSIVGWGATIEHGIDPDNMREVEVPVLSSCKYKEDFNVDTICAGLAEGGKDACQGDSGGPFMCRNPNNPSQWYLAGIVSHGLGCARPNEPGVYTKVSRYVDWIAENIRDIGLTRFRKPLNVCPGYVCKVTGKCVPRQRRCDKFVDCLLADDEEDCDGFMNTIFKYSKSHHIVGDSQKSEHVEPIDDSPKLTQSLVPQYFKCKKMLQIIPESKRCDKMFDCEDGSDEANCTCTDYIQNTNPEAICDGITDCIDLSDESDCVKCNTSSEYLCRQSQICIDLSKRCDGVPDCSRKEDEWDCVALTNGATLTVDSDLRPELSMSGIITINRSGVWRPFCKKTVDNEASIAAHVCNLLGFEEYINYHKFTLEDRPLNGTIENIKPINIGNVTAGCEGLYVRCSNISLDSSVLDIYEDNISGDVELYTSPWNAVIYSDGIYRCMGTILDTHWIVTSINCFKGITKLQLHYVVVQLGKGKPKLFVEGPYEQTIRAVEALPIENSDILLLRLGRGIIYTRYVKPSHLKARRHTLHKEKCLAYGFEGADFKIVSLSPIKNCKAGRRCFESKIKKDCNNNSPWSGTIVCDSRSGWYPAAVFNEDAGYCGLSGVKEYTSVKFYEQDVVKAMRVDGRPVAVPECYGFRCKLGDCIQKNKTCDGIPDCRSAEDEDPILCYEREDQCHLTNKCECPVSHIKCNNNKCVPKSSFCDRNNDCGDYEDEPAACTCAAYLALTNSSRICDGVLNCKDRTDEAPELCHCRLDSFKCESNNLCLPHDLVCDGVSDCPKGEDEANCLALRPFDMKMPNLGEIISRTAGVWHSGCFNDSLTADEMNLICLDVGFVSMNATHTPPPIHDRNITALRPAIDPFSVTWLHKKSAHPFKLRMRTGNQPHITFVRDETCHRLFVQC